MEPLSVVNEAGESVTMRAWPKKNKLAIEFYSEYFCEDDECIMLHLSLPEAEKLAEMANIMVKELKENGCKKRE